MMRFWMVWREGGSAPTYKHPTPESAAREAERLARANPGELFHVMAADSYVQKNDLTWSAYDDEMPF